jgi:hypothetical protein
LSDTRKDFFRYIVCFGVAFFDNAIIGLSDFFVYFPYARTQFALFDCLENSCLIFFLKDAKAIESDDFMLEEWRNFGFGIQILSNDNDGSVTWRKTSLSDFASEDFSWPVFR